MNFWKTSVGVRFLRTVPAELSGPLVLRASDPSWAGSHLTSRFLAALRARVQKSSDRFRSVRRGAFVRKFTLVLRVSASLASASFLQVISHETCSVISSPDSETCQIDLEALTILTWVYIKGGTARILPDQRRQACDQVRFQFHPQFHVLLQFQPRSIACQRFQRFPAALRHQAEGTTKAHRDSRLDWLAMFSLAVVFVFMTFNLLLSFRCPKTAGGVPRFVRVSERRTPLGGPFLSRLLGLYVARSVPTLWAAFGLHFESNGVILEPSSRVRSPSRP